MLLCIDISEGSKPRQLAKEQAETWFTVYTLISASNFLFFSSALHSVLLQSAVWAEAVVQ